MYVLVLQGEGGEGTERAASKAGPWRGPPGEGDTAPEANNL